MNTERTTAVIARSTGDQAVLLNLATGDRLTLNPVASRIWTLMSDLPEVSGVVDHLVAEYDIPRDECDRQVHAFLRDLEARDIRVRRPSAENHPENSVVVLDHWRAQTPSQERLAAAGLQFQDQGVIKLPGLLSPPLLEEVLRAVDRTAFYERQHTGIGRESCAQPGVLTGALEFLLNDAALLETISVIARCGPVGCFQGRVYRMVPGTDHHDSWHSDVGEDRLVAMSINLGAVPYEGGALQITRVGSDDPPTVVTNHRAGDAVMFRIDPAYRHRVNAVTGHVPRTAYAGWFRARPAYADLIRDHLN